MGGGFDPDALRIKLEKIESDLNDNSIWDDHVKMGNLLKEKNKITDAIAKFESIKSDYEYYLEFHNDLLKSPNLQTEKELILMVQKLLDTVSNMHMLVFLNGKHDNANCFMEIHAGAGGTEAQDWAEMILRMYTMWADKKQMRIEQIDKLKGDAAGIKSATIKINGDMAYGLLKNESGIHRLVRISPFDSNKRRHTSFASVYVYPEIENNINIEIDPKDLRIDTYRASGSGGQHVNKTDSAIRITHIPTKTVVQCQNDRSQHKNKDNAMKMLMAKLYEIEKQKEDTKKQKEEGEKSEIGWGHQVRSYVLHPYKMVKDLRTSAESTNPENVLDGDLDKFIESLLLK